MRYLLLLCAVAVLLGGCAYSGDDQMFELEDPYADVFRRINAEYRETWFTYGPTALGNLLGAIAYSPIAMLVAPTEWLHYGGTDYAPVTEHVIAEGAYVGGFALGTPWVILHWIFYKGWAKAFGFY